MYESTALGFRRGVLGTAAILVAAGCSSNSPSSSRPSTPGDSDFVSTPPGYGGPGRGVGNDSAGVTTPGAAGSTSSSTSTRSGSSTGTGTGGPVVGAGTSTPRTVEETDIYRLEGDRLYFLNAYRGLMVFDVSDVDSPRFLGRSPIYGYPVEMTVHDGVANVVVSDWYGKMDDGTPFHGSIVRGIDARDPANMRITGEAKLGGTVRDTRVVGEIIYAVTERYPWEYGWYGRLDGATSVGNGGVAIASGAKVSVSAVSFAGNGVRQVASYEVPGENGIFNVTPSSILLASAELGTPDVNGYAAPTGNSNLTYVDISDPRGSIVVRGQVTFPGYLFGYGTDNGRWNLDFADGATAHVLACGAQYCGSGQDLTLTTADFTNPDQPKLRSSVGIPAHTWSPAVRFDGQRMYLSPAGGYYYDGTQSNVTPIQIFDLSNAAAPSLKGTVNVTGQIWNFTPAGDRLFALGNDYNSTQDVYGSPVVLHYLDVTDAAAPKALGTAAFGQGWAWTPAAGTFKAFAKNDEQKLVVLPFSGYSSRDLAYNNGLQLIEFTSSSITTGASAKTRGWVERGIFVKNRLVSLSDLALSVVDYTNRAAPSVVAELTLARNVVDAKPQGNGTVAELSSDWWGNDVNVAELRILDAANVDETKQDATLAALQLPGVNARVFHDGSLSYVATQVSRRAACPTDSGKGAPTPQPGTGADAQCEYWHTRVQVIDRSGEQPVLRGRADLPETTNGWGWGWGWGWYGCYVGDWYYGSQFVQVGGDVLAMQSYELNADGNGWHQVLTTVSLKDPDAPVLGSTAITQNNDDWWGNMRAIGEQLYVTHYQWLERPFYDGRVMHQGSVRYFADRIDLSVPASPRIGARINVPGILVGASPSDPNLIYTMDYRWYEDRGRNVLAVSRIEGDKAYYQGGVEIPGYVGNVIVNGTNATFTVQEYGTPENPNTVLKLYQANLTDPAHPTLRSATPETGWGWLLDVQGDRAFVTSGWGDQGIDVFKLSADAPPVFDQFVRTRGWYPGSLARENSDVYFASGYWGTEHVVLK